MSRGLGRLQRQIVRYLEKSPERRASRRQLEKVFVDQEGHTASNLLRAIRSLERMYHLSLRDVADKDRAFVSLPRQVERISEDYILALLRQAAERP
jgi:hypothetical protein